MTEWINGLSKQGRTVTSRVLQAYLLAQHSINVSCRRIMKQLNSWGFRYRRGIEVSVVNEQSHERLTAKYAIQFARACQLEQQGSHVIVYTDESYCFHNHADTHGWFPPDSEFHVHRSRRAGRYVILHAITRDGLLIHEHSPHDGELIQPTLNAEYIYPVDTSKKGDNNPAPAFCMTVDSFLDKKALKDDYHGYVNNELWLQWWKPRLVPAFEAKYPGKKMILCMDNARYHKPRPAEYLTVSGMRKAEVVETMQRLGIPHSPSSTVKELKKELSVWRAANTDSMPSITHQLMYDRGWQLLWTPPHEPDPPNVKYSHGQSNIQFASRPPLFTL